LILVVWGATHALMVAAESMPPPVVVTESANDSAAATPSQAKCVSAADHTDIDFFLVATDGDPRQLQEIEAALCLWQ